MKGDKETKRKSKKERKKRDKKGLGLYGARKIDLIFSTISPKALHPA